MATCSVSLFAGGGVLGALDERIVALMQPKSAERKALEIVA
jgi:hypothetical protein